jgi:hypothetical protein
MLRDEAYHILSDLIYKGFLFMRVNLAGKLLIFKTINDKELSLIKLRSGFLKAPDYDNRYNLNYSVYSLFMLDDESVFEKREERFEELCSFFKGIPAVLYKSLLKELMTLRDIEQNAYEFIEGFCYTDQSRRMWKILGDKLPNQEQSSGIRGTDKVGLNIYQNYWIDINKIMDEEDSYNREFSLTLFAVSASNSKGAKKNRAHHDAHIQALHEHRKKIAKEGIIKETDWSDSGWAVKTDTAEALIAELERQMHGIKDKHDNFVENYLDNLKNESERQAKEVQDRFEAASRSHEGEPMIMSSQRALTPQEAADMMAGKSSNNLVMLPSEDTVSPEEAGRYFKKIGSRV